VSAAVAAQVAVALPESGVVPLSMTSAGSVRGAGIRDASRDLAGADAVLIGPGLDDAAETARLLPRAARAIGRDMVLVLDAFALGALAGHPRLAGDCPRILTPNLEEATRLLGREPDDLGADTVELARRYRAVVSCFGRVASPDGRLLADRDGDAGLGTSGSGDALAGAITGLAARGAEPLQAAVWGTYLHTAAGDALSERLGRVGFLASEIVDGLTAELDALS
jgi:NAD(P)H-hydrate repair Nnr-like enzyme with NAD(P)H-hydrate dehydratase domain